MNRGISATNNPGFGMNRDNTVDQVCTILYICHVYIYDIKYTWHIYV